MLKYHLCTMKCISASKKNVVNTKCQCRQKYVFFFCVEVSIKWQQCFKLGKWNQCTSLFYKLISVPSLLPEHALHDGYNVLRIQRRLHFVLIKRRIAVRFSVRLDFISNNAGTVKAFFVILPNATVFKWRTAADFLRLFHEWTQQVYNGEFPDI